MLGEVGGGEDRGSYWVSLILSFVSLWSAFVYTVSSGQEFLQQKACVHVGIFRADPSFLLVLHLLTWLSSLQSDLKGGLEMFNLFSILPLRGNEIWKQWLGANMLMFFWWRKRLVMSRFKSSIELIYVGREFNHECSTPWSEISSPFGCCVAIAQRKKVLQLISGSDVDSLCNSFKFPGPEFPHSWTVVKILKFSENRVIVK